MSVRKKPTGKYQVQWRDAAGKQHAKNFDKRGEADTFNRDKLSEVSGQRKAFRGGVVESPGTHLERFAEAWLQSIKLKIRPQTFKSYDYSIGVFVAALKKVAEGQLFGGTREPRIGVSKQDARAAAVLMPLKKETKRRVLKIAHAMFDSAVSNGLIGTNPLDGIAADICGKKSTPNPKSLPGETLAQLLRLFRGHKYETLVLAMGLSGLRVGEAIALQWSDIDFERGAIRIERTALVEVEQLGPTKSGKIRTVDASKILLDAFERKKAAGGKRFVEPEMDHPGSTTVVKMMVRLNAALRAKGETLGAKVTSHVLRHSWARLMVEQGAPITWLRDQAGHASVAMTVDLYGAGAATSNRALADRLAESLK